MSDYRPLDSTADVLPVGLQPTPFGEVWQALQQVAASVWDVDPSVYRAGMAWLWYAVNHPDDLASDGLRALLVAALISEQAPMVKDWQTNAELVEYLRVWRTYSPTYAKLEAIFATFGARVEVRPISDAESQGVVPVADRRLAFYLRVEDFDAARPLTLEEVSQIAVRATPLGSRPVPYFALVGSADVFAGPASAGLVRALWASEPAEPVTPPTPAYTEITLYMASNSNEVQKGVTSQYVGSVSGSNAFPLFYDQEHTNRFEYDYSNNYEVGEYVDGVWTALRDSISDLPDSTAAAADSVKAYILYDTGELWICSNSSASTAQYDNKSQITVRIYPKGQQHYAAYFNYDNAYANNTFSSTTKVVYFSPTGGSSARFFGHYIADNGTLVDVLDSAGSSVKIAGDGLNASSSSGNSYLRLKQSSSVSRSARVVIFTMPQPTFIGWLHVNHTNQQLSSGTVKKLLDGNGNEILYNANLKYTAVCIFAVSNSSGAESLFNGLYGIGSDVRYPGALCFGQVYGSITANRVWITMETVDNYIWAYFTNLGESATTNTMITNGNVYSLFDASGDPILYSALNSYETLEVQYYTSNGYLLRGTTKFDSFSDNGSGQLQCTARFTNTTNGAKRLRVWIKPLIDIDVNFGDPVTIPAGYEVESVTCSRGYAFATNVVSSSQTVNYEIPGEKVYFDDTNTALVGVGIAPALQVASIKDLSQGANYLSTKSGTTTSYLGAAQAYNVNTNGYLLKGQSIFTSATTTNAVYTALQTFPVYFNLSDSSGNWLYFRFRVPQTLWQFQNGTFSWLGDTTDSSDLAYWYNTRAVRIHLMKI